MFFNYMPTFTHQKTLEIEKLTNEQKFSSTKAENGFFHFHVGKFVAICRSVNNKKALVTDCAIRC